MWVCFNLFHAIMLEGVPRSRRCVVSKQKESTFECNVYFVDLGERLKMSPQLLKSILKQPRTKIQILDFVYLLT